MESEKCLIDRNQVYQLACAGCTRHGDTLGECSYDEPCERLIFAFTVAAPVDAVPVVHGRWIPADGEGELCDEWDCSICERRLTFGEEMVADEVYELNHYCPSCGAKMDGGEA